MRKKIVKKIASVIEFAYQAYGVCAKIHFHAISNNNQSLIFRVIPQIGTRKATIFDRAEDIKTALQLPLFRPFEEGTSIYVAASGKPVGECRLQTMLNSTSFRNSSALLPIALGYDLMERMVIADLAMMPHAMYVGASQSGKSIGLICLILSLLCRYSANKVNLIIFDIGASTLDLLGSIPHLSHPIVKDMDTGAHVVTALAAEMERRIRLDSSELCSLPAIVCVMDEYVSFMDGMDKTQLHSVKGNLTDLLRRGRKARIHMVLATQNPTNKVMQAEIGNVTSRMAFKVARTQDSITALNCAGAEKLSGHGAMLYQSMEHPEPIYVQGAYISTEEIEQLLAHIQTANQDVSNMFTIPGMVSSVSSESSNLPADIVRVDREAEKEFVEIVIWALKRTTVSVDQIKHEFSMGNRANGIMSRLCTNKIVSEKDANKPRDVLPQSIEEIPDDVKELLVRNGVTSEELSDCINHRICNSSTSDSRNTE